MVTREWPSDREPWHQPTEVKSENPSIQDLVKSLTVRELSERFTYNGTNALQGCHWACTLQQVNARHLHNNSQSNSPVGRA